MTNANMIQATKPIMADYIEAKELKQQIKTLEIMLDLKLTAIKTYMGTKQTMFGLTGGEIVTYKQGNPRIVLNTEMLKTKYEKIYNACCETKEGSRVLLLK